MQLNRQTSNSSWNTHTALKVDMGDITAARHNSFGYRAFCSHHLPMANIYRHDKYETVWEPRFNIKLYPQVTAGSICAVRELNIWPIKNYSGPFPNLHPRHDPRIFPDIKRTVKNKVHQLLLDSELVLLTHINLNYPYSIKKPVAIGVIALMN